MRNNSNALYSHYGINVAYIHDLRRIKLVTRNFSRRTVNGLSKCIDRDALLL
jgi:exonuclease 3'-5' domain-containing protein 1